MLAFNEVDSLRAAMYRALEELVGKGGGSYASAPSSRAAAILQRALGRKQEDEQKDKSLTYDEEVLVKLTSERPSVWERLDKLENSEEIIEIDEDGHVHAKEPEQRLRELELDKTDAGLQRGKLWDRVMGTDKRVGELEGLDEACTKGHLDKTERLRSLEDWKNNDINCWDNMSKRVNELEERLEYAAKVESEQNLVKRVGKLEEKGCNYGWVEGFEERVGSLESRDKTCSKISDEMKVRLCALEEKYAELEQCDKDCTDAHHRKDQRTDELEDVLLKIPRQPGDGPGGEFLDIRELFNRMRGAEIRLGNVEKAVGFKK